MDKVIINFDAFELVSYTYHNPLPLFFWISKSGMGSKQSNTMWYTIVYLDTVVLT